MGKFVTNWDIKDWASFLGSYLGGTLGALKYNINRNLNDKDLENKIFSSFKIYSYVLKMQKFYMIRLISYTH